MIILRKLSPGESNPRPEPTRKSGRKGLRRVSPKKAKANRERTDMRAIELKARPVCEACPLIAAVVGPVFTRAGRWMRCGYRSRDLHEPTTRARSPKGDTIKDVVNSVATCREAHDWTHDHNDEPERVGLLIPSHNRVGAEAFAVVCERVERARARGLIVDSSVTEVDGYMRVSWQSRTHDGEVLEPRFVILDIDINKEKRA